MENETVSVKDAYFLMKQLNLVSQEQTVRKWIREGKLEATKEANHVGYRISVDSLEKFVQEKQLTALKRKQVYQQGFKDGYKQAEKFYKRLKYIQGEE